MREFNKSIFFGVILIGALTVQIALAAPQGCDSEAWAIYQKKSVEVEMALIKGEMGDIEATGKKEKLHGALSRTQEKCKKANLARMAVAKAATESF